MVDLTGVNVLIRGAGGMGSGIAVRLMRSGIFRICMLEQTRPRSVQRLASFAEAVYEGVSAVEGVPAAMVSHPHELPDLWGSGCLGVLIDPMAHSVRALRPTVCIDATGERQGCFSLTDAPLVIGLRPAHQPGVHAHVVIETSGPRLGEVLYAPSPDLPSQQEQADAITGNVFSLHAPGKGMFRTERNIGEQVKAGEIIGALHTAVGAPRQEILVPVSGTLRGILRDYTPVSEGNRLARIDPREDVACHRISDRVLAVGGGVLEAILATFHKRMQPPRGILH